MDLAGDIGGTKTHLALYDESGKCVREKKFPSQDYQDLKTIVDEFGAKDVERACFGIAGPIKNGVCRATNLPWVVDVNGFPFAKKALINDLVANAYGIRELNDDEIYTLNEGDPNSKGNQALISAGTGLGEAGMFYDGKTHIPFSSEGGHCDFAPRNENEIELLRYLIGKFGHASYERILSGPGLYNVYTYLVEAKKMPDTGAKTPMDVSVRGMEGKDETCHKALEVFVKLYGAEAGNTALKMMALGGVFIGGGIAPKILEFIETHHFMNEFSDKGRFKKLMDSIPVKVVLNDNTALLGAKHYAQNLL
ncbi:MAG: Glucokinase [Chlamydiia bacterium]|nr:Glucokinase [Chlamydiia bacterium]MCH9616340.1 Glucokinase [Chlamydiia bacterium]MCH9629674.1 Glucokinase [Chlamydiia bacterium]